MEKYRNTKKIICSIKENSTEPIEKRQFLNVGEQVTRPGSITCNMIGNKTHNYPYAAKKGAVKWWRG
jgi:hypothetical protein